MGKSELISQLRDRHGVDVEALQEENRDLREHLDAAHWVAGRLKDRLEKHEEEHGEHQHEEEPERPYLGPPDDPRALEAAAAWQEECERGGLDDLRDELFRAKGAYTEGVYAALARVQARLGLPEGDEGKGEVIRLLDEAGDPAQEEPGEDGHAEE